MQTIGVVDYGVGNIASVMKAVDYAGANPVLVSTPDQLQKCDKLILPGVGAAGLAISKLREAGIESTLNETVRQQGKPLLGICVGMQLMAEDMYEFGHHKGLGWVPGRVISLRDFNVRDKAIPHMGWNDVFFHGDTAGLTDRLGPYKAFYFAHSFAFVADNDDCVCASVNYGRRITAGLAFNTVRAFQFHPEKSQLAGDILMQWFIDWKP